MSPRRPANGGKTVGHPDWAERFKLGLQKEAAASSPKAAASSKGRPWAWNRDGGWRWTAPAAAAPAAGATPQDKAEIAKLIAENEKLKKEK